MANILWAYDEERSSFSALPASPWLLPAIAIAGVVAAVRSCQPKEIILDVSPEIDKEEYERNKIKYRSLMQKYPREWTEDEWMTYRAISYPSWWKEGPPWGYSD